MVAIITVKIMINYKAKKMIHNINCIKVHSFLVKYGI